MPGARYPFEKTDDELRLRRYNSPSRRRLADEYHRARGEGDLVEGGETYVRSSTHDVRDEPEER